MLPFMSAIDKLIMRSDLGFRGERAAPMLLGGEGVSSEMQFICKSLGSRGGVFVLNAYVQNSHKICGYFSVIADVCG
jgi:hypothetical protein